ncbi:hypothetical protein KP509_02G063800 [Ceratopteris richardii]|uniref:Thioredoxin domain-containing protein n=1 Tax=Ceratopteris richardii TaxID=49495 RepID=A0A8T2VDL6_CERRI|nr:hypothetical protein KP509_02G063800 [Ceratopteris richardii]KAH7444084.1 hypothetical protein KP509_02G063800 [Ceratopteris richardii]
MDNCHADGRRKQPSAIDMYVGALNSKLYSPSRELDGSSHNSKYNAPTKCLDRTLNSSSDSFWREPVSQGRSSLFGSFREDSIKSSTLSSVDSVHILKSVRERSASSVSGFGVLAEDRPGSSDKAQENVTCALNTSISYTFSGSQTCSPNAALPGAKTANTDAINNCIGSRKPTGVHERVQDVGRSVKSAELGLNGAICNGVTFEKFGDLSNNKNASSANNLKDKATSGRFDPGDVKLERFGFADALSAIGGSPKACKDGRRWPSFGSQGSTDSIGSSPTAKDGARRSSFSNGGSSDGGSPMAKDMWKRSSAGGYSSADSSGSSLGSPTAKDSNSRRLSSNSILNDKDLTAGFNLRGMGNIFSNGNPKNSTTKATVNCAPKSGDALAQKLDSVQVSKTDPTATKVCAGKFFNSSLGNICPNVSAGDVLGANLPKKGSKPALKAEQKPFNECNECVHESNDPESIKKAGNEQYKMGNFMEAISLYDKCIGLRPDHAPYRSNKAAALTGLGMLAEAVQECEEAIRLDPKYFRAQHRIAQLYLRLGLLESARRHFQSAGLQDDARDVQSLRAVERHISRCIEARKIGDWKSVLGESIAASTAGADSAPQVLGYKAEALLKLHRTDEAETVCTEAERLEKSISKQGIAPADAFLSILRARIEMYLGRFDIAIGAAQAATKIDPRNVDAAALLKKTRAVCRSRTLGNELFNAGKFFEACAAYGEGLESDPTNSVLLCNRAACRSKLGQWEKALEDCNAALNSQPHYIKALMRRANCSLKLERWEDALRDYEVLRLKVPDDVEVSRGLFEAQVAIKKARGEDTHRMRFGGKIEEVFDTDHLRDLVKCAGTTVVQFCSKQMDHYHQICSFVDQLCKRYPCVRFLKVDIDENSSVAKTESIISIPTFRIFENGCKVKELLNPSQQDLEFAVRQYN